jgi:hypothetical protein
MYDQNPVCIDLIREPYYDVGIYWEELMDQTPKKSGLSDDMIDGITFVVVITCIVIGVVYWLSTYQVAM